jgi:vitamin B12 transporter
MPRLFHVLTGCLLMASAAEAEVPVSLERINVTATRTARTLDQTLAPVEIITRCEIERSQALDVPGLLAGRAGIDLISRGGYGSVSSLFLRGSKSEQVLVLVDGVRVGPASSGGPSLHTLPLDRIERIEIVRGPRSSLYGADAIGGVIQIFTRQGQTGLHPGASLTLGSNETRELSADLAGGRAQTRYQLGLSSLETDGINAIRENNPDRDGYTNQSFNAGLAHEFTNHRRLDLQLLHTQGRIEYDDEFDTTGRYETDFLQQVANARFSFSPARYWDLSLSLGESRDETDDLVYGEIKTRRTQASWLNDLHLSDRELLTAGIDLLQERIHGSVDYAQDARDNRAVFGQYQGTLDALELAAGLRYDDNQAYGGHTTGNLALGYALTPGLKAILSYGTAFKAPSFNDLYYPGFSNPELLPEESASWELGLTGEPAWGDWELRLFVTETDNLIQYNPNAGQPENIATARIKGLESRIATRLAGWDLAANLTLLDPRDEDSGELLQRRARQTLRLDADRRFSKTTFGLSILAQDGREDLDYTTWPATPVELGGYALVDLRLSHRMSRDWQLRGQIKNLFDQAYETVYRYNSLGRELFITLAYAPES